jgi:uncharacterized protein YdaU (DUF1376 family)
MAKDPAILFYVQDFLIGSSLLTALQKGHYITLLCYQQQSETGSLKVEEIQSLMKSDFKKHWPVIKKKFKEDHNGFFNQRMRDEMERRNKYSESRRNNRKSENSPLRPQKLKTHDEDMIGHMSNHMETATEIENKKGGAGEKSIGSEKVAAIANEAWSDKGWRDNLCAGQGIKSEAHLKRWMAQFNASVSNDFIAGFDVRSYKKMIGGWIPTQKAKGRTVDQEPSVEANASANYRFKKIS